MYQFTTFEVKPMRLYKEEEYLGVEELTIGDIVVAKVISFHEDTIWLRVGDLDAYMDLKDYSGYDSEQKNAKSIVAQIGKKILTRVKWKEEGLLTVERLTIVEETVDYLKEQIGNVLPATVEKIQPYGAFIDIGNGVQSLIPIKEICKNRQYNLLNTLKEGESIKVKLLKYDEITSYFEVSRKQAYHQFTGKDIGMVALAICSTPVKDQSGVFVEYDPANTGIMDVPENMDLKDFPDGKQVKILITKVKPQGFRANFIEYI